MIPKSVSVTSGILALAAVKSTIREAMKRYRAENSEACLVNGAGEFAAMILKKLNERAK